jgi:hypothetical protein
MTTDEIHQTWSNDWMPNVGINTSAARRTPAILPIVETPFNRPADFPADFRQRS